MSDFQKVALVGNPNCGKTALFNSLTGGRAKVGNYPGVTVERKESDLETPSGTRISLLDLPGTYSLDPRTLDEKVTHDVIFGLDAHEKSPDLLIVVADATHLERCLGLVVELKALGKQLVLALNMMDLALQRGIELDLKVLSSELGVLVIPTVAPKKEGLKELLLAVENELKSPKPQSLRKPEKPTEEAIRNRFKEVDRILAQAVRSSLRPTFWNDRIDRVILHPVYGSLILLAVLALVFQAVFTWAEFPMEWIKAGVSGFGEIVSNLLAEGPLKSLLVDGVIAGVGAVLVYLPQILLLFLFILILEDSGYMSRAAFLMDRLMGKVGLHGKAFIPLLSSFACAIPGIMATRTIENRRDRLATILVAPLMTCSARLPVYSLLIAAFIPNTPIFGPFRLQGLVMLGLYLSGVVLALAMAVIFRRTLLRGPQPPLLIELPTYKWPTFRNISIGLIDRAQSFVQRAGTVILAVTVVLWFTASYPKPPVGATEPAIHYSFAGQIGKSIETWVKPIGFNWKIAIALVPSLAAREVMVGSLATVYAVEGKHDGISEVLGEKLARDWSLPTALSLLVWYIAACQCLSTLAVTRRETNSWRWPAFMFVYMTSIAYFGSWMTFQIATKMGL